jgi:gliding motility-associated-like protein
MKNLMLVLGTVCMSILGFGQKEWSASYQKSRSFIENIGQFDEFENSNTGKIKYAVDFGSTRIFFGESGICYSFLEAVKIPKEEREALAQKLGNQPQSHKQYEKLVGKFRFKADEVNMTWNGKSKQSILTAENETEDYHNYAVNNASGVLEAASGAKGYQKLIYKNIYPNIDVEYTVHPEIGIKYAIILNPGAKPELVDMFFDRNVQLVNGELSISTLFGPIIDHAPITFYGSDQDASIASAFVLKDNHVHFHLGEYNHKKVVTIDPWTQTPVFATNWDIVWECERDGSGNVYILGGIMPMQILKYNPTGTLQWTYNTPYDTSNVWLGTFAVDNAGNSYVTAGSVAQIQKVSTAGAMLVNNASPGGILSSAEFWTISFNCDQTSLIIGGTGGALLQLDAVIYNVNTSNLNITNQQFISNGPMFGIPPDIEEVRAITSAPNGKYYFMTHDTIGFMNDNFTLCPNGSSSFFKTTHGANFGYKCEDFRFDNTGLCALAADETALYMHRGSQLQKRSLTTGAIISTVAIPGGAYNSVFLGGNTVSNSGIAVDDCGNVYVGSTNGVYKFNSSLVQQAFYPTSFKVYDVEVNSGGEIIACGGTGTSNDASRSGGVQTFAASACIPIASTCCDASICIPQNLCVTDPAITLTPATPGGTWSGTGVNASGSFNPTVAGVGSHSITYTLPCGSETITILVSSCASLQVCEETNGNVTVSSGVGPYTWQVFTPATTIPITTQAQCTACGYSWFFGQCLNGVIPVTSCSTPAGWVTFGTGTTVTPPAGATQIQVIDNTGNTLTFNPANVLPCGSNPCPTLNTTISNQTNINCLGNTNGSATVTATGGSGPYNYTWTPGNLTGGTQSNLAAGTYTVNITDANNCPGSTTVNISQPTALAATATATPSACGAGTGTATVTASGGTGTYTYSWSPSGGSAATASNLSPGAYTVTVTDGNSCTTNATANVSATNGPTISVVSSTNVSCNGGNNGSATVSATGGSGTLTYSWTPGNLSGTNQNNLAAGTYTVTVTDGSGCSNATSVQITQPAAIVLNAGTTVPADCGVNNGSASITASGGTGNLSYAWSPNVSTTASATNIASGNYTVTVTDQSACSATINVVVPNSNGPTVTIQNTNNVSCFGLNNGSATANVTGGTAPYTYFWSPSGGSLANASGLSAGTYTVSVTDVDGCIGSASVTITAPNAIAITETIIDSDCASNNGQISVVASGGSGPYTYAWQPNSSSSSTVNGLAAGTYTVTVTDAQNCSATETYIVDVQGTIPVSVSPSSATIFEGESVVLTASGGISYTWTPSNGLSCDDCAETTASPSSSTIFTVTATDASGCQGEADVLITVIPICGEVFVPTVLSPNGAQQDDNRMACVYGNCIQTMTYSIYNRWGEKVFETQDPSNCWDGTYKGQPMNPGVFAYKLQATLITGQDIEQSGNITLLK